MVPWGRIECYSNTGSSSYLRWAPGDCTAYDAVVSYVGYVPCGYIGGDSMVSIRICDCWKSIPLSLTDIGIIHTSLLEEHLFSREEDVSQTMQYTVLIYTIMLNHALLDNDMSKEYVDELKQHPWIKPRFGF
jgi:hypothetical protein